MKDVALALRGRRASVLVCGVLEYEFLRVVSCLTTCARAMSV